MGGIEFIPYKEQSVKELFEKKASEEKKAAEKAAKGTKK